jgi:hypothetical protein
MAPETMDEVEEVERWNRIAMHVRSACVIAERDGKDVLIKFDGARDNGYIYTVVTDVRGDTAYRMNSINLEEALSQMLGSGVADVTLPKEDFADTLRTFNVLSTRGFVISVIISHDGEHLKFDTFLSGGGKSFATVREQGPVLKDIAAKIVREAEHQWAQMEHQGGHDD